MTTTTSQSRSLDPATRGENSPDPAAAPAHVTRGVRRVLEIPAVYHWFQNLLGSEQARRRLVREFIRPFPGMKILDLGCGTGDMRDFLPADVNYAGCDLNPAYIRAAQDRHGDRARFFCADVTADDALTAAGGPSEDHDLVLAFALLHHLDDPTAGRLCRWAHANLKPGGAFVSIDGVRVPGQSPVARYMISKDRGQMVRDPQGYLALTERGGFPRVESHVLTDLIRVPYTHFVMRAVRD